MSGPDLYVLPDSPSVAAGPVAHYEGFADMKGPKDKDYEKTWLMLIDKYLYAYNQKLNKREASTAKPIESLVVDKNWEIKPDPKEKTKLAIKCKAGQFKFRMSTQDDRDNWWIRFHAMSKRTHPNVHLLPGQTIALQEIIDSLGTIPETPVASPTVKPVAQKTFVKQKSGEKPQENESTCMNKKYHFYPEELVDGFKEEFPIPPTWFLSTTRLQAEEILLNNPEYGAILIRESETHRGEFSLSMRQDPPLNNVHAQPIVKHFRFSWAKSTGTYRMEIEEDQPQLKTMYDLLAFFIEKHGGNIRPLQTRDFNVLKIHQHPYERGLRLKDPENGEAHRLQSQDTYLAPQRAAPAPPSKPRPERQSLPASFNMTLDSVMAAEAGGASNAVNSPILETSNSQYVSPDYPSPAYLNTGREKLDPVIEDINQNMTRRQQRFSTSEMPTFTSKQPDDDLNAPALPPPRQRAISSSEMTPRAAPSLHSPHYLTPTNTKFWLNQAPGNQPLPTAIKPNVPAKPSIFKPPTKSPLGVQHPTAPPTSYIHQDAGQRGDSNSPSSEGRHATIAQGELTELFKKFGLNNSST